VKALEVHRERIVNIPVDVVWQLVEPAKTLPSWLPIASRCEILSGRGLGRRQRLHGTWGRKRFEIDQLVVGYEPNALLRWKHVEERLNGKAAPGLSREVTVTIHLETIGPGTLVALRSQNVPSGILAALVLRLVARRRIRRAFDRALENLAAAGA
jgi:hypothetical protein